MLLCFVMLLLSCDGVLWLLFCCVFFFFKQKTAYEMRISDWSSDVCSSDLPAAPAAKASAPKKAAAKTEAAKADVSPAEVSKPAEAPKKKRADRKSVV